MSYRNRFSARHLRQALHHKSKIPSDLSLARSVSEGGSWCEEGQQTREAMIGLNLGVNVLPKTTGHHGPPSLTLRARNTTNRDSSTDLEFRRTNDLRR